jgi:hypothetical protein
MKTKKQEFTETSTQNPSESRSKKNNRIKKEERDSDKPKK